jgi:DNA topoisomerase VI subunit B
VGNAVKYTPAGGSISISVKQEAEEAVLRVHDTGIGISPDLLPQLFELFVQGDPGSTRVRTGWGSGWPSSVVLSSFTAAPWRRQVTGPDRAVRSLCVCRESPRVSVSDGAL